MLEKLVSFTQDVSDLTDRPSLNPSELKAAFDAAPNEVREYLNKLIDALKKTETGDSGAKNIGATAITDLTGTDIQSILESLKTYVDKGDGKRQEGQTSTLTVFAGNTYDINILYSAGFTKQPVLNFDIYNQDIDGAYKTASSIVENGKDSAKIRLKNNNTTTQYYIVYWQATEK
jgi:hypothetical protein